MSGETILVICAVGTLVINVGVVVFALGKLFANVSALRKDFNGFAMRINETNQNNAKLLQEYGYNIGFLMGCQKTKE